MQHSRSFTQRLTSFLFDHAWEIIILVFLVLVAYIHTLNYEFVSDDLEAITNNKRIGDPTFIFQVRGSLWIFLHYLSYISGGFEPGFYRIINICVHLINVLLVYVLINLLSKRKLALATAAIFAVHPIMIEAVTWVSGGAYALYTMFLLFSFIFFIFFHHTKAKFYYVISLSSFFLALLTSERSVIFPLILVVYYISFYKHIEWRRVLPFIILGGVATIIFGLNIWERMHTVTTQLTQNGTAGDKYILTPVSIFSYLHLLIWPRLLTLYHTEPLTTQRYSLMVVVIVIFFCTVIVSYFKSKHIFFWLAFFIISLLPMITPLRIASTVAERYIYMSSLGLIYIFVYGLYLVGKRLQKNHFFIGVVVLIVGSLLIRTLMRNQQWQTREIFWQTTVESSPISYQGHYNLGLIYRSKGEYAKALNEFAKTVSLKSNYAQAYFDIGYTYQLANQPAEAVKFYKVAIQQDPNARGALNNLGNLYFRYGKYNEAETYIKQAIQIAPNDSDLYTNLGIIYLQLKDYNQAKQAFEIALKYEPGYPRALQGLQRIPK